MPTCKSYLAVLEFPACVRRDLCEPCFQELERKSQAPPIFWRAVRKRTGARDPVLDLARRHGLRVIEDAAEAHGATYRGRRAGSFGDVSCFSFYPTKNLGAIGDGGLVATNDAVAENLNLLRQWHEGD